MKYAASFILLILLAAGCAHLNNNQSDETEEYEPRDIAIKADYKHPATEFVFPQKLMEFERTSITSYDSLNSEIFVAYQAGDSSQYTRVLITLQPATNNTQGRLQANYMLGLYVMADIAERELGVLPRILTYGKDDYKTNGLYAEVDNDTSRLSLTVFQCGKWFIRYIINTNFPDKNYIIKARDVFIEKYNPVDLIKRFPLEPEFGVHIAPAFETDFLLAKSIAKQVDYTVTWMKENVDSLELCSGFPELYLEFYSEPLKKMIEWVDENQYNRYYWASSRKQEYLVSIRKLIENDFLNEFLMEQYSYMLIPFDNNKEINYRFKEYRKWKEENMPDFNLHEKMFFLEFIDKDETQDE